MISVFPPAELSVVSSRLVVVLREVVSTIDFELCLRTLLWIMFANAHRILVVAVKNKFCINQWPPSGVSSHRSLAAELVEPIINIRPSPAW